MNKLRTDSVFSQLTPEQVELLEGWLFEENLGYKEALERVEKEFQVKGSLSGLRRFYRRLALERSREDLVEMAEVCADALKTLKTDGTMQAGLMALGYKCAMELLVQSPGKVREFTALLRALTSAQALEMKRMEFQRSWNKREAREIEEKANEERKRMLEQHWREQDLLADKEIAEERRARRAAKALAAAAAASTKLQEPSIRRREDALAGQASETAMTKLQLVEEQAGTKPTEVVASVAGNGGNRTDGTDGANKLEDKTQGGAEAARVAA